MKGHLFDSRSGLLTSIALTAWLSGPTAQAVIVDLTVTPSGVAFHYEVSVFNTEALDLAIVSLTDAPVGDALIGTTLTGPAEFLTSYDGGLGIIDLLEGASPFLAGITTSGFSFDSLSGPAGLFTTFEALSIEGDFFAGDINVTVVPEPNPVVLASLGFLALVFAGRKPIHQDRSKQT